jgi:hypothetical protein
MDTAQTEKLKALALAPAERVEACIADVMARFPTDSKDYYVEVHQHLAPLARQLERQNDALIAEVERLRAELAAGAARQGGNTSGNPGPETDVKTAETRMVSGSEGGPQVAAPAAGTEKDADRLLAAIVRSDVGIATRHKLEDGQGTATEDGKNWLAAIEFVAAAHTKAGDA